MPPFEKYVGVPMLRLHDKIYRGTNGRIGHHFPGGPKTLILHTVGAKTGAQRSNSLAYTRDGDDYIVVASKGGAPASPGWYFNLKAHPQVEVNVGPRRFRATARGVTPDDADYARLWKVANDMPGNRNRYNGYQQRTTRAIPVVVLTPARVGA
ncbi:nitroreductase family deazaflavin-dependent oxidoreductase [Agromyces protaetiae]|uniref:Nitroreductase family deazaflavin-dependent oxidoreductase n=2 Tax=Agromyces protaetiae TaxID=2509455 RepID=A0A4P6FG63_9MICO|nr:nitroreductase family deazaflavin-dependent oxidoreductase [Agromyces protaetiae]